MQTVSHLNLRVLALERGNVVTASGEIDLLTADQLDQAINQFPNGDVIVDFANVDFIDLTGLKVLVTADRQLARRNARLVIRNASATVMRLMEITGLDDVFHFDAKRDCEL